MKPPFRAYDIRGLYPEEVNEELAYAVGRGAVIFLNAKEVVVGRDCRTSSLALKKSLVYGITDQGCNVIDTGYCNTPMLYYVAQKHHCMMITASHNPKQYNGIKITKLGVEPLGEPNGLQEVEKVTRAGDFPTPETRGTLKEHDFLAEYCEAVRNLVNGEYKPLKVLIDAGNGMAGHVVPELMKGLPIKWDLLYGELDGTFPNHTPNPVVPENTADLQKKVVEAGYDLGIAYDSDCDRVFFIDEKGNRIRNEYALILFARHLMKPGEHAIYTANMGKIVKEILENEGYVTHASKIGHTEIPITMKKHDAVVGGEITGHFYFKDFKYADSGDIAALMMISQLSKAGKPMSELIKPFQKYATSEETNFKVDDKDAAMKRVEEAYKDQIYSRLDGLSIDAGDYWFNLRLSKTENLVRLNAEAINQEKLDEAITKIGTLIQG